MKYWLTADFHLGHENIIKYCERPFSTLEEMNAKLIRRFNSRVKPEDITYFLGDFCFHASKNAEVRGEGVNVDANEYLKQLNGNFVFVRGNHDTNNTLKTVIEAIILHAGGKQILCVHDPRDASSAFELNLCGHVHQSWKYKWLSEESLIINVGVDVNNYYPVSLQEVLALEAKIRKTDDKSIRFANAEEKCRILES